MIQTLLRLLKRRVVKSPPAPLRITMLLFSVLAYGTTGFLYFELPARPELGWADGFWWSLVTMTTIGYGDLFPTTPEGRFLVAVPLMFFGIGLLGYVLSLAATTLVEARTRELRGMNDFKGSGHIVVVNFPSVEKVSRIIDEIRAESALGEDVEIVLIDDVLAELPQELALRKVHFVRGNPTQDATLRRANIDRAQRAIVLARPGDARSDAHVLAVTLAIEGRSKAVRTISECTDVSTEELLRKAGCDSIVCTSRFDAHFLSSEVVNPGVHEVVEELLSHLDGQQLYFAATQPKGGARFGALAASAKQAGHLAIGLRRNKKTLLNLADDFAVEAGDDLVTIGDGPLDLSRG